VFAVIASQTIVRRSGLKEYGPKTISHMSEMVNPGGEDITILTNAEHETCHIIII
ncbi:hypothetical protein L9F63_022379, partial [Diploptera punctata]